MTEASRTVLEKYQTRQSKKQKESFREFIKDQAEKLGFDYNVEKGDFGSKNIVIGDPENAKVLYTAHYDTAPVLPFPNFITPKNFFVYILYVLALCILTAAIMFPIGFASGFLIGMTVTALELSPEITDLILDIFPFAIMILVIVLLSFGPANKHTVNDNTSGVITLLEIMHLLPEEARKNAAFVFFDLEEQGLFGSSSYRSKHKKMTNGKLLINFDCVSDGENILFAVKKKAKTHIPLIERAFEADESVNVEVASKGVFYPSDQMNFPIGVGVAALKKSKRFGVLYMDRIHTKRDTVLREENIEFLSKGAVKLATEIK